MPRTHRLTLLADHPTLGDKGTTLDVEHVEACRLICLKLAQPAPTTTKTRPSEVARNKPARETATNAEQD